MSIFYLLQNDYIWLVVSNMAFIFHNIWDNPSHWLSYFSEGLKPPTSYEILILCKKVITFKSSCPTQHRDYSFTWVSPKIGNAWLMFRLKNKSGAGVMIFCVSWLFDVVNYMVEYYYMLFTYIFTQHIYISPNYIPYIYTCHQAISYIYVCMYVM